MLDNGYKDIYNFFLVYMRCIQIKLKNAKKKKTVTVRRVIFLFLKASIANLITLLFSSLQNSEGNGNGNSGDSCADPPPPFLLILKANI